MTVGELSVADSRVAFELGELGTDTMREQARTAPSISEYAAPWKGGLPEAPAWLAQHGWRTELHNRQEVTARYGRADPGPFVPGGYVTATRNWR
jgi:hypothetical protein